MHKKLSDHPHHPGDDTFDLEDLLHPAQAFGHPMEVVHDPDLTLNEKRAILASWASDSCAWRRLPSCGEQPQEHRLSASTT